jgi:hypothetical protein
VPGFFASGHIVFRLRVWYRHNTILPTAYQERRLSCRTTMN